VEGAKLLAPRADKGRNEKQQRQSVFQNHFNGIAFPFHFIFWVQIVI